MSFIFVSKHSNTNLAQLFTQFKITTEKQDFFLSFLSFLISFWMERDVFPLYPKAYLIYFSEMILLIHTHIVLEPVIISLLLTEQ